MPTTQSIQASAESMREGEQIIFKGHEHKYGQQDGDINSAFTLHEARFAIAVNRLEKVSQADFANTDFRPRSSAEPKAGDGHIKKRNPSTKSTSVKAEEKG
jgi:hypothetical protein